MEFLGQKTGREMKIDLNAKSRAEYAGTLKFYRRIDGRPSVKLFQSVSLENYSEITEEEYLNDNSNEVVSENSIRR
jgi:hypothetical protein